MTGIIETEYIAPEDILVLNHDEYMIELVRDGELLIDIPVFDSVEEMGDDLLMGADMDEPMKNIEPGYW